MIEQPFDDQRSSRSCFGPGALANRPHRRLRPIVHARVIPSQDQDEQKTGTRTAIGRIFALRLLRDLQDKRFVAAQLGSGLLNEPRDPATGPGRARVEGHDEKLPDLSAMIA